MSDDALDRILTRLHTLEDRFRNLASSSAIPMATMNPSILPMIAA